MDGCRSAFRRRGRWPAIALLSAALAGCQSMDAAKKAVSGDPPAARDSLILRAGHTQQQESSSGEAVPEEFAQAEDLFRREDFPGAEKLFRRVADDTKNTPLVAEKARFYQAECLRRQNHLPSAADCYNRMLKDFPAGVYREHAVLRMFEIADFWLDDTRKMMEAEQAGKSSFFSTNFVHWDKAKPFLDQEGRAMQVLEQCHYNDPTGPCSDKALYLLGYVHFYRGNFKEADAFFSQLVDMHDKSPLRARAMELAIMAKNNSTGGPAYDGRASAEALKLAHQARASMPELANRAQFLDGQMQAIRLQQAEKDFGIAEFYRRTGRPGSAYFCYELVRRRYPETDHAKWAEARMNELRGELDESRQDVGFWKSVRRGWNKHVLGAPQAELLPGQPLPPGPGGSTAPPPPASLDAVQPPKPGPSSLPNDLMPRQ